MTDDCRRESPEYLRMSLAAAMTLGFKPGLFYRDARLYCVNLLLTYQSGCAARCSYCGLSRERAGQDGDKSFIRVSWPTYGLDEIIAAIAARPDKVKRICISQVTNTRSIRDSISICQKLRQSFDIPVSMLISPTVTDREDLAAFKEAGADKIGVALDLATPELFDRHRGRGVGGPHSWFQYVERLTQAIEIFGARNAGSHFVVGMGESEVQMCRAIQQVQDMGGWTHLFSFFPEAGSALENHPMPDMAHYRRIQLARHLIDSRLAREQDFAYDAQGRIVDFGVLPAVLDREIDSGEPFRTSGCAGYDGQVACNRPYANSRPGPDIRNFPFPPEAHDIARIRWQMGLGGVEEPDAADDAA